MEFLVVAYDGTDPGAGERRLKAREAHMDGARRLKDLGNFIQGGAILNEHGSMIGSTLYMDFPSRKELDDWLSSDPYSTGGVWVTVKVEPIRLVFRN
jgi:uncharacterized protein YciI